MSKLTCSFHNLPFGTYPLLHLYHSFRVSWTFRPVSLSPARPSFLIELPKLLNWPLFHGFCSSAFSYVTYVCVSHFIHKWTQFSFKLNRITNGGHAYLVKQMHIYQQNKKSVMYILHIYTLTPPFSFATWKRNGFNFKRETACCRCCVKRGSTADVHKQKTKPRASTC